MKFTLRLLLLAVFFAPVHATHAQKQQVKNGDNQAVFGDLMYRQGNAYRTASGKPGPEYWQNQADYEIAVELDDKNNKIKGDVTITYTNNSPQNLDFVWLQLEQNRFTADSRGTLTTPTGGNRYSGNEFGGYDIKNVKIDGNKAEIFITDTRMKIYLPETLEKDGENIEISMDFSYKIPQEGMDRMGRLDVKDGTIYAMAQWHPRMAVFDDVVGWNNEPYLGAGEFYLDYGNFDYKITVPASHIVVGSGVLQNPEDVLTEKQQERMEEARNSNERVYIIKPKEVGKRSSRPKNSGKLTWHFKMENTRDIAFASSEAFIWDAAKIDLPEGKMALAQSAYPKESDGKKAWGRSTEYTKASIEYYSNNYYPYPYKTAINVAANVGGMEYPGVSFCSWKSKEGSLWGVTDHEFGHNWFPMIVGSNERRYAWMDEGFNTFINHYSTLNFNDGEYPSRLGNVNVIQRYLKNDKRESINTYPDVTNLRNLGYTAYYKPAVGLIMLREYILDTETFDKAFNSYIETWAYKHPQPSDFFNFMENAVGENLNWFWKTWFYGNGNIDINIKNVEKKEEGYSIQLENNGEVPMPVKLTVTYADASKEQINLPVEIWQRGNKWQHLLKTKKKVEKVQFDADGQVVDINKDNDLYQVSSDKSN